MAHTSMEAYAHSPDKGSPGRLNAYNSLDNLNPSSMGIG
eukprot:CAMPEP_0170455318 /NCGR_PEP_ID=MMETSP0123-20130129/3325_1 /TAXON_ID=182087 /ORGANISM="Favella ehrenbergii, Strain Fehren 1" /LENGTH=38 /DNA_ID= /DNA_START= /DNA_END= /DNA_ORIENTATION=